MLIRSLLSCLLLSMGTSEAADSTTAPIPLPEEDRANIEQYLGKDVVVAAIPAPRVTETTRYLAAQPSTKRYLLVSGPEKGLNEEHKIIKIRESSQETTWEYRVGTHRINYITGKANGDYVINGMTDIDDAAITRYTPSEVLMPQGLAPGEHRQARLGIKVFDLGNPDDQTHEGYLDMDYRYIGAYRIKTPSGTYDSVLIRWDFKGKIGPANVEDTQYRFFSPDLGNIAAIEREDVTAMMVYNRHRKIAKLMVSTSKS